MSSSLLFGKAYLNHDLNFSWKDLVSAFPPLDAILPYSGTNYGHIQLYIRSFDVGNNAPVFIEMVDSLIVSYLFSSLIDHGRVVVDEMYLFYSISPSPLNLLLIFLVFSPRFLISCFSSFPRQHRDTLQLAARSSLIPFSYERTVILVRMCAFKRRRE